MLHPLVMFLPSLACFAAAMAADAVPAVRYRRVGGIRFLRVGRLQFSFCKCREG